MLLVLKWLRPIIDVYFADVFEGPRTLLYTGAQLNYNDQVAELTPNTKYDYVIEAYNDKGYVTSLWNTVTTYESAPTEMLPPHIVVSTRKCQMKVK